MKRLVHRTGCKAVQRVCDSGQLIHHLVGYGGTLQNNRSPAPELQDAPSRSGNENEHHRQKLLLSCNVYRPAKQMYWIVREHLILSSRLGYSTS